MARENFSDSQKAEIYSRDHALCCFTGKNLWILDYGASPTYQPDWVDHIIPASKGGKATIDNGILTSAYYNYKRGSNTRDKGYIFHSGFPTGEYYFFYEKITKELSEHIKRFSKLEKADWYFNRALYHIMLGIEYLFNPYDINGNMLKRDSTYYSKASIKKINEWRTMGEEANLKSLKDRNLIPKNLSHDQKLLLTVINAQTHDDIIKICKKLLPFYKANYKAIDKQVKMKDKLKIKNHIESDNFITPRVKNFIKSNIEFL